MSAHKKNSAPDPSITVRSTDINSTQDFTNDPDLIELYIGKKFIDTADKAIAFMSQNEIDEMRIYWAFGSNFYALTECLDDSELVDREIIKFNQDEYAEFDPEYATSGCTAIVNRDGTISVSFPFKHISCELWCEVGRIEALRAQMENEIMKATLEVGAELTPEASSPSIKRSAVL